MQVHVVLRVGLEVFAVVVDRHLRQRQPAVVRFALVAQQRNALPREVLEQRREAGVVDHDELLVGAAQAHADVLPHLDGHGAGLHRRDDALARRRQPGGLLGAVDGEAGGPRHVPRELLLQRDGHTLLVIEGREVGVVDIDRQHLEVLAPGGCHERGRRIVQVHVRVDLRNAGVVRHRVAGLTGGVGGEENRPGQQDGNGEGKRSHRDSSFR
jgi:hypothetical protein